MRIVRIGTSGAIQPGIPVDSILLSDFAIGFDGLLHFYESDVVQEKDVSIALNQYLDFKTGNADPYVVKCDSELANVFRSNHIRFGTTATNSGFYGPQGRRLRLDPKNKGVINSLSDFSYRGMKITNLEMETAGIYGLSKLLGHQAISLNCILANRSTGEFSKNPTRSVDELIKFTLEKLTE